jgi:hypothetical protein
MGLSGAPPLWGLMAGACASGDRGEPPLWGLMAGACANGDLDRPLATSVRNITGAACHLCSHICFASPGNPLRRWEAYERYLMDLDRARMMTPDLLAWHNATESFGVPHRVPVTTSAPAEASMTTPRIPGERHRP